jgi:membrane protease subunit HflK
MSWNESGNGKDPWKGGGNQPDDLDKIIEGWQKKINAILGGKKDNGNVTKMPGENSGTSLILIFLLVAWAFTGLYRVDQAERGVVQRFGAYTETTFPGLHWHIPFPIESVDIVNTGIVTDYGFSTEILTADEQYVFVQMVVQYLREDPVKYSFEVINPEGTLEDLTESALREVVGTSSLEVLVNERRDEIGPKTQVVLQSTLDAYKSGISVTSINLEKLDYPRAVQDAVDDTQKARNDSDRFILEAEKYAQDLIPRARGAAQRILQDAEAYRDRVIADAEGQANRFLALLNEYEKAPKVTRDRLYLDAVEEVYKNSNKVILDSQGSGNLLYLPIDKLMNESGRRDNNSSTSRNNDSSTNQSSGSTSVQDSRERRQR